MFGNIYEKKKVLVTGHTGFKGSWLTTWLLKMGAEVCGVSKDIPTTPSMFLDNRMEERIEHHLADIRDLDSVASIVREFEPDFVFHLAAQAIVSESYSDPLETISTNVIGTANILEVMRSLQKKCVGVIITSDKCYENVEWEWGYKETDHLGGKDIYSASKGCAELVFHAYQESFFSKSDDLRLVSCRAGNVIGGGDWAKDRIIVDCIKSWTKGLPVEIRSPSATRPWQHVLEPLSGYLTAGYMLYTSDKIDGESFNFGPKTERNKTVSNVIDDLAKEFMPKFDGDYQILGDAKFNEAGLLKLNCDKALFHLKWEATLYYNECIKMIAEWYANYVDSQKDLYGFTLSQISFYEERAEKRGASWTRS